MRHWSCGNSEWMMKSDDRFRCCSAAAGCSSLHYDHPHGVESYMTPQTRQCCCC